MKSSVCSSACGFAGTLFLWFFFAVLFLAQGSTSAGAQNNVEGQNEKGQSSSEIKPAFLDDFINNSCLQHASVGVLVMDAESGEVVMEHQPDLTLVPASLQKLLTSAAALQTFGESHTFDTKLLYRGTIDSAGTLHGDVILRGGGDPTFGSPRFAAHYGDAMRRCAMVLQQAGIKKVDGDIIADASLFGPPQLAGTWIWEDIGNYYGAAAASLNYLDNSFEITFATGAPGTAAKIIKIAPELPEIAFRNSVMAGGTADKAYIYGSYLTSIREIGGTLPPYRNAFTIRGALPDPALAAINQLHAELSRMRIVVEGATRSEYENMESQKEQTLLTIVSPPLVEIIGELNQQSINLYAETLLLHLALDAGKTPVIVNGCEVLANFWKEKGMNTTGLFLADGSGLSRANGITARQLAFVLQEMLSSNQSEEFLASLPVAGQSGTLSNFGRGKPIEGKWRAKTGTMSRVTGYAGVLKDSAGHDKIVVVMVNNFTCSRLEIQRAAERLMVGIFDNE
ncbi:MAG: D-alanyl-D-alanine carboxypeptidase/D-alanyl-D-alanine-endopeptidase [Clostridia bacterium]|nr:D-alanyl-D-alanine carboxypeptidase/D-alanyl-D-alanine-endopeptidase [Clostridia bacterium]